MYLQNAEANGKESETMKAVLNEESKKIALSGILHPINLKCVPQFRHVEARPNKIVSRIRYVLDCTTWLVNGQSIVLL